MAVNSMKYKILAMLFLASSLISGCVLEYADYAIECRNPLTGFIDYDALAEGPVQVVYYGPTNNQEAYYRFVEYGTDNFVVVPVRDCQVYRI